MSSSAPRDPAASLRRRRVFAGLAALALALALPALLGVVPPQWLRGYAAAALLAASLLLRGWLRRREWSLDLALLVIAAGLALAAADLAARAILGARIWHRPEERFFTPYPRMPLVGRYRPDVRHLGETYGDLASAERFAAGRERRQVRFETDGSGFRNPARPGTAERRLDLVLLGDSFGAGSGTSQEETWASLLASRYGLVTYDLSMDGASPWQEYVTLAMEAGRLPLRPGTIVLWAMFAGNDLEETYRPIFDLPGLPWRGPPGALLGWLRSVRERSPVGLALGRLRAGQVEGAQVIERTWVDGSPVLFYSLYDARRRRTPEGLRRHPHMALLDRTVAAMAALARSRSFEVVVVLLPSKEEVYGWLVDRRSPGPEDGAPSGFALVLRELCDREGMAMVDFKPGLVEAAEAARAGSRELIWWRDDTHWNRLGHAAAAEIVEREVIAPRRLR